jgi:hypothetical protein
MVTIKIECDCGQRYEFDVEPVNGLMSAPVACPACGADGTDAANDIMSHSLPSELPPAADFSLLATASADSDTNTK